VPRLLFASYHCIADPASGAALATRDLLELVTKRGWMCRALCGPVRDVTSTMSLAEEIEKQRRSLVTKEFSTASHPFSMLHYREGAIPVSIYAPQNSTTPLPDAGQQQIFLQFLDEIVRRDRPDVMLTYGGGGLGRQIIQHARRHAIPVVFALHNFHYKSARPFEGVAKVLVPSEFAANYYGRTLGIECTAIPSPINIDRVVCDDECDRRYVTFVNPVPDKGVFVFARLAMELQERRPDIPLLVVEGRGGVDWLARTGIDCSALTNVHRMRNTPDPRDMYRVSRLILMPSLWNESFGRVAAEAQINGIPVLASDRGSLPEVIGDGGVILPIPAEYTPETRSIPSNTEVRQWTNAIIHLWDDTQKYEKLRQRSLHRSRMWCPDRIGDRHDTFFRRVASQAHG